MTKKLADNAKGSLIQGFSIKIPKKKIETYNGSITFNAQSENKSFEEKTDIKVDVLTSQTLDLTNYKSIVVAGVSLSLLAVAYVIYRKIRKRS